MAVGTFVLKVAARCNLDCSYCYVYRGQDQSWRRQPPVMSDGVAEQAAWRIREYCESRDLRSVNINFHGGEPLLAGFRRLSRLTESIRTAFHGSQVALSSTVQTNGLLLNPDVVHWAHENNVGIYVSLDGAATVNDIFRVDHARRPTGRQVEERLASVAGEKFQTVFEGFLVVANSRVPGSEVFDFLRSFKPRMIDFLLPLDNHDSRRRGNYASWLIECFDHWFDAQSGIRVRGFERLISRLLYRSDPHVDPIDALIIECDGSIELDDTLKTSFPGAVRLEHNVFDHSFDTVLSSAAINAWRSAWRPAAPCRQCAYLQGCGGGHIAHRYSTEGQFDNPTIYCDDMKAFIAHMTRRIVNEVRASTSIGRTQH